MPTAPFWFLSRADDDAAAALNCCRRASRGAGDPGDEVARSHRQDLARAALWRMAMAKPAPRFYFYVTNIFGATAPTART